ncbi:hypothetical protein BJY52DRAFT_1257365 [Lactarius psammicola]|nr:hypothetical protein BJY52DRAFT_1257365 [Lactarius psammicola]
MHIFSTLLSYLDPFLATGPKLHASATTGPHLSPRPSHLRHVLHSSHREGLGHSARCLPRRQVCSIPCSNSDCSAVGAAASRAGHLSGVSQPAPGLSTSPISPRARDARPCAKATTVRPQVTPWRMTLQCRQRRRRRRRSPPLTANAMSIPPCRFFPSRRGEPSCGPLPESSSSSGTGVVIGTGAGTTMGVGVMPST